MHVYSINPYVAYKMILSNVLYEASVFHVMSTDIILYLVLLATKERRQFT